MPGWHSSLPNQARQGKCQISKVKVNNKGSQCKTGQCLGPKGTNVCLPLSLEG